MPSHYDDMSTGQLGPFFLYWTLIQPIIQICIGLNPLLVLHCAAYFLECFGLGPFFWPNEIESKAHRNSWIYIAKSVQLHNHGNIEISRILHHSHPPNSAKCIQNGCLHKQQHSHISEQQKHHNSEPKLNCHWNMKLP
jgi:hypothetical protein